MVVYPVFDDDSSFFRGLAFHMIVFNHKDAVCKNSVSDFAFNCGTYDKAGKTPNLVKCRAMWASQGDFGKLLDHAAGTRPNTNTHNQNHPTQTNKTTPMKKTGVNKCSSYHPRARLW